MSHDQWKIIPDFGVLEAAGEDITFFADLGVVFLADFLIDLGVTGLATEGTGVLTQFNDVGDNFDCGDFFADLGVNLLGVGFEFSFCLSVLLEALGDLADFKAILMGVSFLTSLTGVLKTSSTVRLGVFLADFGVFLGDLLPPLVYKKDNKNIMTLKLC